MEKRDFILKLDNALSRIVELKCGIRKDTCLFAYLELANDLLERCMSHVNNFGNDTFKSDESCIVKSELSEGV